MALACVFHFLLFSHLLPLVSAVHENKNCPSSFDCGYLGKIEFPFTITEQPFCGILAINGCLDQNPNSVKTIKSRGTTFGISHVDKSSIIIKDPDQKYLLRHFNCEAFSNNYTLPPSSSLASFRIKYSATFFKCNQTLNISTPAYFFKYTRCPDYNIFYASSLNHGQGFPSYLAACSVIQLPIHDHPDSKDPFSFLTDEIHIEVGLSDDCSKCHYHEGGRCRVDGKGEFYCAKEKNRHIVLIIAAAASAVGCALLMILACCFQRIIFSSVAACVSHLWMKESPTHQIIETFLKEHGPFQAKRYSYVELNKLTNAFKDKLGQGGYGSVYKGRLQDGSLVAVKVLSELKGNGEDFINEVASMSKTSHVNIISLLGFCLEGSKRALIYEFMPNGSLDKFIYEEKDPLKLNLQLDCKTLYNIAIGVARGLEYLHGGCNTKILHFDIKPHNILLDEDFHPKISDFGFAKICPRKESVLSLFTTRGTAGYIAPEVFSKNFGGVSHKSDVYSFGMMVLEIVGGRHNININVDCPSEIYFPRWIYKRFQLNEELGLRCIKTEDDEERVKKMIITSLWCIQTDPINRPTMSEVVDMLEGNLESLQIPPKPFVSSPSTSQPLISAQT